ncbi:MAG: PH domain-containing protein [Planctomycetes bacterium]|nr:PH domain-containing protein [Planctomycetota bacterium]
MTPSAQPASPVVAVAKSVPAEMLEGGEIIILAVRPSGWFVILDSLAVLILAGALAAGLKIVSDMPQVQLPIDMRTGLTAICGLVWLQLLIACFRWAGRLYILTNRRVMTIRGVLRPNVSQCHLRRLAGADLRGNLCERILGLGTVKFRTVETQEVPGDWEKISRPAQVVRKIQEAMSRS